MKLALSILAVITAAGFADQLFVSQAETDETVVYRADDHIVALGTPAAGDRLLAEADSRGLNGFALVTVRNENGVSQASELGEVVYRNHRTLIVKLYRPLTGDFMSPDVFSVCPLREDRSPSEPIDIPFRVEYDDTVADIVEAVSEDSLIATITNYQNYLTRHSDTEGYDTACEWSNDRFISYGLDSELRHFSMLGYDCQNVIATQTGTIYPDQYWIICGHLDSTSPDPQTDAPGANDNSSGSSAVMEAARIMSQYDFEYTVRYCLWGGEEQGLYGSTHYADSVAAAGDDILGVVNLDMILWYTAPFDSAEVHYNTASENLGIAFHSISSIYVPALKTTSPPCGGVPCSDHASFWNAGYAAIMNIEQANFMDPYYHSTDDVMDNYLDCFPFGTNMAKASIAAVACLAVPTGTGIEEQNHQGLSGQLALQPVQNPATGSFALSVALPSGGPVTLQVFDTAGRMVRSLVKDLQPGTSEIHLAAEDLSPGMYLVKAISASESVSTRIMLVR